MTLRTTPGLIALLCLLPACAGLKPVGRIEVAPLPVAAERGCLHPADVLPDGALTQAEAEIVMGRLGDALLVCGREKAALAAWARVVAEELRGGRPAALARRSAPVN